MKSLVGMLLVIVTVVGCDLGVAPRGGRPGQTAADFTGRSTAGENVSLSALKGKVVLLDFWATYCTPCLKEMPRMVELKRKYRHEPFEIIGLSTDDDGDALKRYLAEKPLPWPIIRDAPARLITQRYAAHTLPTTVLIDKQGVIRHRNVFGAKLDQLVGELVKE